MDSSYCLSSLAVNLPISDKINKRRNSGSERGHGKRMSGKTGLEGRKAAQRGLRGDVEREIGDREGSGRSTAWLMDYTSFKGLNNCFVLQFVGYICFRLLAYEEHHPGRLWD